MSTFLVLAALLSADARALVERAGQLDQQRKEERARWVAREDIKTTRETPDGSRRQTSWQTFEAVVLEGRLRFRLVARDGKPLPESKQRLQPEGKRSSFDWPQLLRHHDFTLAGEDLLDGRKAWRVRSQLRNDAPPPRKLADVALSGPFEIWIDQATGMECKLRWRVERPWAAWRKGATAETWTTPLGGLFLVKRILVRNPNGGRVDETDQVHSNYRRFSTDSSITFATP